MNTTTIGSRQLDLMMRRCRADVASGQDKSWTMADDEFIILANGRQQQLADSANQLGGS